mgnify:CR=1 FL=1
MFRVFDSLNWMPNMETAMDEVLRQGKFLEGTVCYTGDILDPTRDRYTLEYYVNFAKELERRGAHMLAIKDMSGLLKPYAAKKLVSTLKQEIGIPIHLHTHNTTDNQIATYLMAAEAGVDVVDTAIGPLANLTSQPSMNAVVESLRGQERDTGFDRSACRSWPITGPTCACATRASTRPQGPRHRYLPLRDPRRPVHEPAAAGRVARPRPPLRGGQGDVPHRQHHARRHHQGHAVVQNGRRPGDLHGAE